MKGEKDVGKERGREDGEGREERGGVVVWGGLVSGGVRGRGRGIG